MPLVAWYPCENTDGVTAADASGNGLHGVGTYTPAVGKVGRAFSLNGTSDAIALGTPAALNSGLVTVAAWAAATSAAPASNPLVFCRTNTSASTVGLFLAGTTSKWTARIRLDGSEATTRDVVSDAVATTAWTHLAMTWDGTTLILYVNGVAQSNTYSGSGVLDPDNFASVRIGRHPTAGNFWNGLLDDIRLYDEARTAQQVASLFNFNYGSAQYDPWRKTFGGTNRGLRRVA